MDRHYEPLWSYVGYLTGGAAEAEDILHQAFLVLFDRLAVGESIDPEAGKWLRGAVRNLVHAWWRQKRRLPQDLADRLELLAAEADDAPTAAAKAELRAALEHCLGTLEPDDRQFVAGHYEEGLRITEIAGRMQVNAATARVRLFRLRQALRTCVQSQLAGRATP